MGRVHSTNFRLRFHCTVQAHAGYLYAKPSITCTQFCSEAITTATGGVPGAV
jgi:hypothetical protein